MVSPAGYAAFMSMLTPQGMGGKYRITGNRYPKMRRPKGRRRLVGRTVAAIAVCGLAIWGTTQLIGVFSGGGDSEAQAIQANSAGSSDCKPAPTASESGGPDKLPEPKAITVNVLNATDRTGLAKDTADALEKRGFKIGEIDNAPTELDKKVKVSGLLLGTPKAERDGALAVLGAHLAKSDTRTDKERSGKAAKSVDLVLGDGYRELTKPAAADRAVKALASPSPSPSPC